MSTTAYLSIKTQYENIGDAFIIMSLIEQLSRHAKVIVDVSRCPEEFIQSVEHHLGENVIFKRGLGSTLTTIAAPFWDKFLNRQAYYFLIPGGFSGEKSPDKYLLGSAYNLLLRAMKIVGVKVCQVGMSYDNLGVRHKKLLMQKSKVFSFHYPRDLITSRYFKELGVPHSGVIPDMAFNHFNGAIKFNNEVKEDRTNIIFSFRTDKTSIDIQAIESVVAKVIKSAPQETKFVFLSQVKRDDNFAEKCFNKYVNTIPNSSLVLHQHQFSPFFKEFQQAALVFSNRLHCLLIAARCGASVRPVLQEAINTKIVGIWRDMQRDEDILLLEDLQLNHRLSYENLTDTLPLDIDALGKEMDKTFAHIFQFSN